MDSTLVAETSRQLKGGNAYKKKMIKYTLNYDGMYGCCANVHVEERYASESLALPENVMEHFHRGDDHARVYLIDRGQCPATAFVSMDAIDGLHFVGRLQGGRKLCCVKSLDLAFKRFDEGVLVEDTLAKLYKKEDGTSKAGKPSGDRCWWKWLTASSGFARRETTRISF